MKKLFELIEKNILFSQSIEPYKKTHGASHPLITISREFGSGGSVVAYNVAAKLGRPWKVYHHEIVDEIAKEARLEKKFIKELDEDKVSVVDEMVSNFFGRRYLSLNSYTKHLVKVLFTIGDRGEAVIVGRGANFLFPNALKIRIVGDMEQRVRVIMHFRRVNQEQAIKMIEKSDERRKEFVQTVFRHDPRRAFHYDLVIRTSKNLNVNHATHVIVELAKRRFRL